MAFGSGTLMAAVAFDLCRAAFDKGGYVILVLGFLAGGGIFVLLNHWIDERGGFLRKDSNKQRFILNKKREMAADIIGRLSRVDILRSLPPREVQAIIPFVERVSIPERTQVFAQGDAGDALYIIDTGRVEILRRESGADKEVATVADGETFGEMSLLSDEPRNATAVARTPVDAYRIGRSDFLRLVTQSPALAAAVHRLNETRHMSNAGRIQSGVDADGWRHEALKCANVRVSHAEEKAITEKHAGSSAPLAIFLGAVIDGVPESVVIGAGMIATGSPSMSFLAAVFISNFPEAMASASGMLSGNFTRRRILTMWSVLLVVCGLSAYAGCVFLATAPLWVIALAEAIAGGGILAMLANTMMPEAFELGGPVVALSTIGGFLTAFLLSVFSHLH